MLLSDQKQISTKVLDDLCSRFIINIPIEQRNDPVRVLFAVELAHWFYIDFYCEDDNNLRQCNLKEFAQQIFQYCPFLRHYVYNLDEIIIQWREYKLSVPTYGAILIDPTYEHILLVQGYYNRESWGFPKGKVQENESPLKCAIREVLEEVGFDIKDRAFEDQYLEHDFNGQTIRLYIIKDVPLDTKFAPRTKNEIKEMRWFPVADLPCHKHDTTPQNNLNLNPTAFFMVIPFIKSLRRWINHEQGIYSSSNGESDNTNEYIKYHFRRRTITYHGNNSQPKLFDTYDNTSTYKQRKPSFQKQLSVQDTAQRHFSQILKNNSITVTDNTSITETLLMRENNSLYITQLTPPMSNDDENKYPLQDNQSTSELKSPDKSQHNQRRSDRCLTNDIISTPQEPFSNITNDTFHFNGPSCWKQFRLNRLEVFRCLGE